MINLLTSWKTDDMNCSEALFKDCFSLDVLLVPKISKRHFFGDISNSFQWVTQTGLKPHQNFFFEKILKTDAASPILRFFYLWLEIQIECIKRLQTW